MNTINAIQSYEFQSICEKENITIQQKSFMMSMIDHIDFFSFVREVINEIIASYIEF